MLIDDGRVAIIRTLLRLRLCILDHVPGGAQAPPEEVLEIIGEARNADEIVLSGVVANRCSPAHLRLICKALISDHFRAAYVEWVDGKTLPFAAPVEEGDLRGWWRIDLVGWRLGQYRR